MATAFRSLGCQPVRTRGGDARPCAQFAEADEPRGSTDAVGADEFGGGGMGGLLRDLPGAVISRTDRNGDDGTRAQIRHRRPRRRFAHIRTYSFRPGGNDRKLAPGDRPGTGRAGRRWRDRTARSQIYFAARRIDRSRSERSRARREWASTAERPAGRPEAAPHSPAASAPLEPPVVVPVRI